ncbi:MAG: hypothetical protein ABEK50_13690, partial [bacterium]
MRYLHNAGYSEGLLGVLTATLLAVVFTGPLATSHAQPSSSSLSPINNKTVAVPRWQPIGQGAEQQTWLADGLQKITTGDLERIGEIQTVSRKDYEKRLSEAGLDSPNPNNPDNARRIVNAAQADVLLIGTYQIKNRQIQLSAVFYNPRTESTIAAANKLGSLGQIKSLQTALIKD